MRQNPFQPDWWLLLDDLLYRRTDVATQHVAPSLTAPTGMGAVDTKAEQFKSARLIDFSFALEQAPDLGTEAEEAGLRCVICIGEYEDAVVVKSCGVHRYCRKHINERLNHLGAENANCPLCKRNAVSPGKVEDTMFGLIDGAYIVDSRYSAYENFERSFADLDNHLAENDHLSKVDWPWPVLSQVGSFSWQVLSLSRPSQERYMLSLFISKSPKASIEGFLLASWPFNTLRNQGASHILLQKASAGCKITSWRSCDKKPPHQACLISLILTLITGENWLRRTS